MFKYIFLIFSIFSILLQTDVETKDPPYKITSLFKSVKNVSHKENTQVGLSQYSKWASIFVNKYENIALEMEPFENGSQLPRNLRWKEIVNQGDENKKYETSRNLEMFHYKDKLRLFIYNVKRNFTFITIADEDHVSYNLHIYITTSFSEKNNDAIINVDDGKYEVDLYPHIDIKCIQRFSSGKNKKFGFQYDIYPRNDSLPDEQNAIIGFSLLHYIIMHKIVYGEYKCLYGKDQHIKIELVSTNGYINQFNKPTRTIVELYEPPEVSLILFITVLALSGAMIIFSRNIFLDRTKYRIT